MKQLFLAILLYLGLMSTVTMAAEAAAEQSSSPPKREADSIGSLFEANLFQSHFEENFLVAVGLKGWMSTWSLPTWSNSESPYDQDAVVLFKSGSEFVMMPTLTLRYKNLYLSVNRFINTDFSFGTQKISLLRNKAQIDSTDNVPTLPLVTPVQASPYAERSEWDITAGYYLNEYLAFTIGFKKIERDYALKVNADAFDFEYGNQKLHFSSIDTYRTGSSTGDGMTIGVLGAVPVKGKLNLYGNFAYGWLTTESTALIDNPSARFEFIGATSDYDTPYYSGEIGFSYDLARFKEVGLSSYFGYRFQRYEFEGANRSGQTARDGTDGFIISFSAYF